MALSPGVLAIVVGCAVAVAGLGLYQAWWTVVFPIGGAIVAILERRGVRAVEAVVVGAATASALAMGGIGAFLSLMSGRSCARPPCPDGPPLLLIAGLGALLASAVVLAIVAAHVRRRRRQQSDGEGASSDI
jgi:hypothetical protein